MRIPATVLAVVGGVLMALAFPLVVPWISLRELDPAGHLEWIAWAGMVPALFALERARSARQALGLGTAAGLGFFYTAIYWVNHAMTEFGGLSFGFAFFALSLLVLYMAAHWGLAFAVASAIRRRLGWPLWAHLPLVWAAVELLRNYLFTGFPWANLGYAQARHVTVSQLASLLGIYAIAALVVLVNCILYEALVAILARRPVPLRPVLLTALLMAGVLTYGTVRLSSVRGRIDSAPKVKVGLVQGNVNQAVKNEGRRHASFILERYIPLTREADRAGADLVAWPEAAYPLLVPPDLQSFDGPKSGLTPLSRAHLLLGVSTLEWRSGERRSIPLLTNSVFLLRPDLSVVQRYAKYHLVPFGEYVPLGNLLPFLRQVVPDMAPTRAGRELVTMRFPLLERKATEPGGAGVGADEVTVAPMICYDAIFPEINVAYAKSDPELLFNPTNDAWYGYSSGPYQFLAITRLRAIEAGKAMIRPAYAGVTAVVLPTGEVMPGAIEVGPVDGTRSPDPNEPPRLLLADVPRLRGRTPYTVVGDVFAWGSALFTVVALGVALRRRRVS